MRFTRVIFNYDVRSRERIRQREKRGIENRLSGMPCHFYLLFSQYELTCQVTQIINILQFDLKHSNCHRIIYRICCTNFLRTSGKFYEWFKIEKMFSFRKQVSQLQQPGIMLKRGGREGERRRKGMLPSLPCWKGNFAHLFLSLPSSLFSSPSSSSPSPSSSSSPPSSASVWLLPFHNSDNNSILWYQYIDFKRRYTYKSFHALPFPTTIATTVIETCGRESKIIVSDVHQLIFAGHWQSSHKQPSRWHRNILLVLIH